MDQEKRSLLAFLLCCVFFIAWLQIFGPKPKPAPDGAGKGKTSGPDQPGDDGGAGGGNGADNAGGNGGNAGAGNAGAGNGGNAGGGNGGNAGGGNGGNAGAGNGGNAGGGNGGGNGGAPGAVKPTLVAKAASQHRLESEHLRVELSNRGGTVEKILLRKYYHRYSDRRSAGFADKPENWLPLIPGWPGMPPIPGSFRLVSTLAPGSAEHLWVAREADGKLEFRLGFSSGLVVTKRYGLTADGHTLTFELELANRGKASLGGDFELVGPSGIYRETDDLTWLMVRQVAASNMSELRVNTQHTLSEIEELASEPDAQAKKTGYPLSVDGEDLVGTALATKYFGAVMWTRKLPGKGVMWARPVAAHPHGNLDKKEIESGKFDRTIEIGVARAEPLLMAPGSSVVAKLELECGTREQLARRPFEELDDYGFFGSISFLLLWLLGLFYKLIGNYGWSIIALTALVKIVLNPLTRRQQISMHTFQEKMKKFQPEMEKLKEKYENNRQKQNEEIIKLYRKHGVQPIPVGGCLPIFLQIPIFFGLFTALRQSILLRQAEFLWITDLSGPDRVMTFANSYFFIGHDLNILPIVMTVVWVVQQRLMPKPSDPNMAAQQKIMQFMPIMFGFMLYHFASGLCLYWLFSNLIGIFEQKHIKAKIEAMKDAPPPAPA